mmetsp:Transcript_145/g.267  ORF Transcript_145/g.267 Transcript_145/m.267 type:complete len:118 (+) Transcript_145:2753-3106(+)
MAKREREELRRVLAEGLDAGNEAVFGFFSRFGRVTGIKWVGPRACMVEFETAASAEKALQLNNTRQPPLNTSCLSVSQEMNASKRARHAPGSYVVLDPPRFNNFLIPVLPHFLSCNR